MTTDNDRSLVLGEDSPGMPLGFFEEKKTLDGTEGEPDTTNQVDAENTNPVITPSETITINRKDLQAEIDRLRAEDSDFAQVYNRDIGNKAKQRYQPEIDRQKAINDALALSVRKEQYSQLTETEVNERFTKDPAFAKDYAEVTHATIPDISQPSPEVIVQQLVNELNRSTNFAEKVLPKEVYDQLLIDRAAGKFDVDETGQPYSLTNWREAADNYESYIVQLAKTPVTAKVEPVVVKAPPASDTANPDLSSTGVRAGTKRIYTMQQVREMNIEEKLRIWPNEGDIDRAVESGEISLPTR